MSLGANSYVSGSHASLGLARASLETQASENREPLPEAKLCPLASLPVSNFIDRLPEGFQERLALSQEPPSGTIRIILDLKDINYHRTFYLTAPPPLKESPPVPALAQESARPFLPAAFPAAYASALAKAATPSPSCKPCPRDPAAGKSKWGVSDHPPASVHLFAMSKLGPLSTTLPDNLKKPRLEDKKMIEFMMLQSSKNCSDLGFLHRIRKTIRKVRSYWNKINPVYPFAFRKLRNRNGRLRGFGGRLERLGTGTSPDDLAGFYIITEDFSNKVVNPEGIGRQSDESAEESESESGKASIPDD